MMIRVREFPPQKLNGTEEDYDFWKEEKSFEEDVDFWTGLSDSRCEGEEDV